ncbi:hypothetical protein [Nocardiopsis eucommiae]|uniref:hypothetical protein n=1 Tax=Nocardiopsis eucommiae TaxID=2831970 RepID=UPI003D70E83C
MDAATRRAIEGLTRELQRTQAELATVKRASRRPQLGFSSIESGSLDVVDPETGRVRLRLGYQPDGSVGVVPEGGDPPPAPSAPIVAPAPVGLMVQWDGRLAHDLALPADFDHVSAHVSATSGFTPGAATFQGTIPRAGGLFPVVPLEVGTTYYVQLVGVGTGGVEGAPSVEASGIPEAVGGVPAPGSITETEIADDAVTSPKIRALAVEAHHIVAEAIEAGHITAGAVTASKLAAEIVLASRLIAGNPGADRAEIDNHGIKVYNADGELILTTEGGNLTLTGNIVGSEITGSRFTIGAAPGNVGSIEDASGVVRTRVISSTGQRAQLAATTGQAEFTAWANPATPSPIGGVVAQDGLVGLTLQSVSGDGSAPLSQQMVSDGQATGLWRAGNGSDISIQASQGWSAIGAMPPPPTAGEPEALGGAIYALRRTASDAPALSIQSPMSADGPGATRRSYMHVEGAVTSRPTTIITQAAQRFYIQGELVGSSTDATTDGVVQLAGTHTLLVPRHAPVTGELQAQLTGYSTGTDFYDFPAGTFAPFTFKTGWSGRVRFTINMCGLNPASAASSLALGFRLTGAGTLGAHLSRCAFVRSIGAATGSTRQSHWSKPVSLLGNAEYTLTPCYRITSGTTSTFDLALDNSITVEPLM